MVVCVCVCVVCIYIYIYISFIVLHKLIFCVEISKKGNLYVMFLNKPNSVLSNLTQFQCNVLSKLTNIIRPSYNRYTFFPAALLYCTVLYFCPHIVVFLILLQKFAFRVCFISAVYHIKYLQPLDTICKAYVCGVYIYIYIYIYILLT